MPIYELQEVAISKSSADLAKLQSTTFKAYSANSLGTIVIDKNTDLTSSRRIVNLNVIKPSQAKFNQIISIDFQEFVDNANDPTKFLESKIQSLELTRAKLLAMTNSDKDLIRRLQEEIDKLRNQLKTVATPAIINKVPDTLKSRDILYADRQGRVNDPGYPAIQNKLLSKNRKAIAIIQEDGNFVVYTGNFDEYGSEIRNVIQIDQFGNEILEPSTLIPVAQFGYSPNNGKTPGLKFQISSGKGNLIIFRLGDTTYWSAITNDKDANLSYASKLVLDDDGILTLYDGLTEKWSSKNLDPPAVKPSLPPQIVNKVTYGLQSNQILYSDRTGRIGAPGYPAIQNKLLSKNRKAIGVIQPDGNFVIYTGSFDEFGNATTLNSEVTVVKAFGYNTFNSSPAAIKLHVDSNATVSAPKYGGQVEIFRISGSFKSYESGRTRLSKSATLSLFDNGELRLYEPNFGSAPNGIFWSSNDVPINKNNPIQPGQIVKLP